MTGFIPNRLSRPTQPWIANRKGSAVVEFAVMLPVFVLLLLGTIETCNMIFLQQSLEIAAYESARVTIVPGSDILDVNSAASEILNARRIKNTTLVITPTDFQNAAYGSFIKVDALAPCNSNSVFALRFYGSKTLKGTVEMMKEF